MWWHEMADMDEEPDVNADEFSNNYGGRGQEAERTRDQRRLRRMRTQSREDDAR